MFRWSLVLIVALGLVMVVGCSGGSDAPPESAEVTASTDDAPVVQETRVEGQIRGTDVAMTGAEYDGNLAIFEGDGWGFNSSLLVFLFLDDAVIPEGQSFSVSPGQDSGGTIPHVHYRWQSGAADEIEVEMVMSDYDLTLRFGSVDGDELPGFIEFAVPGEETSVAGSFRAKIKVDPNNN